MGEQQRMWSVTELLKLAIPSPGLIGWAARTVAEAAVLKQGSWQAVLADEGEKAAIDYLIDARWRTVGKAADRGNALHAHAKAVTLGAVPPAPEPSSAAHVEQFQRFLDDFQPEYLAAEAPVYNLAYHYAGTLDAIVRIEGQVCVLDYKTTDKGPGEGTRPPYDEVALQLCAYARAELMGVGPPVVNEGKGKRRYYIYDDAMPTVPMPATEGALALMVSPVDYQLHPARVDEAVWSSFLYAREVARWVLEYSRTAIGPPVVPRQAPAAPAATGTAEDDIPGMVEEGILVEPEAAA